MSAPTIATDPLTRLASALVDTPAAPAALDRWRRSVRHHLDGVRDLLVSESGPGADGWLVARGATALRRRNTLMGRVDGLASEVLHSADVAAVRRQLRRLLVDVQHHRQRISDLAWDEVELELGGED